MNENEVPPGTPPKNVIGTSVFTPDDKIRFETALLHLQELEEFGYEFNRSLNFAKAEKRNLKKQQEQQDKIAVKIIGIFLIVFVAFLGINSILNSGDNDGRDDTE
jgi:hypothetical protein